MSEKSLVPVKDQISWLIEGNLNKPAKGQCTLPANLRKSGLNALDSDKLWKLSTQAQDDGPVCRVALPCKSERTIELDENPVDIQQLLVAAKRPNKLSSS